MTKGQNLKLKRRTMAKESHESRSQDHRKMATMGIEGREATLTVSATSKLARTTDGRRAVVLWRRALGNCGGGFLGWQTVMALQHRAELAREAGGVQHVAIAAGSTNAAFALR